MMKKIPVKSIVYLIVALFIIYATSLKTYVYTKNVEKYAQNVYDRYANSGKFSYTIVRRIKNKTIKTRVIKNKNKWYTESDWSPFGESVVKVLFDGDNEYIIDSKKSKVYAERMGRFVPPVEEIYMEALNVRKNSEKLNYIWGEIISRNGDECRIINIYDKKTKGYFLQTCIQEINSYQIPMYYHLKEYGPKEELIEIKDINTAPVISDDNFILPQGYQIVGNVLN